jgi:apolipoprotein N-acyltransferase
VTSADRRRGGVGYRLGVLLRCLSALLGGAVLAAAFEPIGWAALMPLGLATLFLTVRGLPARRAWLPSLLFGIAFLFLVMVWMRPVGNDAWLAMCGVLSLFFIPLGVGLSWSMRSDWWPVLAALWWVAVESIRSVWPFSGMPFGRLAYATAGTVWQEALPYVGMTGVSLLIALSGAWLAWAVVELRRAPVRVLGAGAGLAVLTALPHLVPWGFEADGTWQVAAVQGNVPGDGTDVVANHREITANHVRLTEQLAAQVAAGERPAPDLVVWPENSTAVDPFLDTTTQASIRRASEALGAPILVGAMVDAADDTLVLNQGIVWHPGRGGGDRYTKRHPVPYGEYIPFRDSLFPSNYGKLRMVARDMARGVRVTPLDVDGVLVADAICFDVAYDEGIAAQLNEGGRLLVVQTSNAMFIHTAQVDQQFEISRLRAVEARRSVVVAALNGISGIVAPDGSVLDTAPRRTEAVLSSEIQLSSATTPATRAGVWPSRLIIALVAAHVIITWLSYRGLARRNRGRAETTGK